MLESKELRIGNFILDKDSEILIVDTVTSISVHGKSEKYNMIGLPLSWCNPIPLNEDWLLKFGFNCDYNKIYTKEIDLAFSLRFEKNEKIIILDVEINYEDTSLEFKHVKYVHQLQNVIYALTGKELTIKKQKTRKSIN